MLLVILWLVYVTDCFLWLDKHAIVFAAWWGQKWQAAMASESFGSARGGLYFLNPVPPLGRFCINHVLPVSISSEYIVAFNSQTLAAGGRPQQSGIALPIPLITKISVRDKDLWLNGSLFCRCKTTDAVLALAELLDAIRQSSTDERCHLIEEFWSHQFDAESAKDEQVNVSGSTQVLRGMCVVQFVYLYLLLPGVMTQYGVTRFLIPSAIFMLVMGIAIAMEFALVHKQLFPGAKGDRISHVIKMILCPPVSIRAVDLIMAQTHSRHNSLTLATVLLGDAEREAFIITTLRDLRFPIGFDALPAPAVAACKWQNATIERIASQRISAVDHIARLLDKEPARQCVEARSFCPRCLAQLSSEKSECPDCPGVPLQLFAPINTEPMVQPNERNS